MYPWIIFFEFHRGHVELVAFGYGLAGQPCISVSDTWCPRPRLIFPTSDVLHLIASSYVRSFLLLAMASNLRRSSS